MFRAPSQACLPHLSTILSDLSYASPREIARHLGITPAALTRYTRQEQAPRPIMLALFWETRWGRSAADTEAVNWAAMHHQRAAVLERENAALRRQIAQLESLIAQGAGHAANAPHYVIGAS